ncbi:MAG: GGDEF domain-containing protein [Gaiellaceae bacterium]
MNREVLPLRSRETLRLSPVVLPVTQAGAVVLALACLHFTLTDTPLSMFRGLAVLLAASLLAEAFPVPLEALPGGHVAMSAVFIVGAAVLYGWPAAILIGFLTRATLEIVHRRPAVKLAYNGSVYAMSGAAAGAVAAPFGSRPSVALLFVQVALASLAFYAVNIPLVSAIVARWARQAFLPLLRRWVQWTFIPSAIMASVTVMLAAVWRQSPYLTAALVGPMLAIALYQRSVHSALKAMRLALTDPVTGLGNHRHFHERLQTELDRAEEDRLPLSLCLVDLDDFKRINDRYGHPDGDVVLAALARRLRSGGEAFRVGGDEFALLLPACLESEALDLAQAVVARLTTVECPSGERISVSAGVATFPTDGLDRASLLRAADEALYRAKREGKNCARPYAETSVPDSLTA